MRHGTESAQATLRKKPRLWNATLNTSTSSTSRMSLGPGSENPMEKEVQKNGGATPAKTGGQTRYGSTTRREGTTTDGASDWELERSATRPSGLNKEDEMAAEMHQTCHGPPRRPSTHDHRLSLCHYHNQRHPPPNLNHNLNPSLHPNPPNHRQTSGPPQAAGKPYLGGEVEAPA